MKMTGLIRVHWERSFHRLRFPWQVSKKFPMTSSSLSVIRPKVTTTVNISTSISDKVNASGLKAAWAQARQVEFKLLKPRKMIEWRAVTDCKKGEILKFYL